MDCSKEKKWSEERNIWRSDLKQSQILVLGGTLNLSELHPGDSKLFHPLIPRGCDSKWPLTQSRSHRAKTRRLSTWYRTSVRHSINHQRERPSRLKHLFRSGEENEKTIWPWAVVVRVRERWREGKPTCRTHWAAKAHTLIPQDPGEWAEMLPETLIIPLSVSPFLSLFCLIYPSHSLSHSI